MCKWGIRNGYGDLYDETFDSGDERAKRKGPPHAPAGGAAAEAASLHSDSDEDPGHRWKRKVTARMRGGGQEGAARGQAQGVGNSMAMGACLDCDLSALDLSRLYV